MAAAEHASSDWALVETKEPNPTHQGGVRVKVKDKNGKTRTITVPWPASMEVKALPYLFWDAETLDTPANTASQFGFLQQIVQGTGSNQRVGNVIAPKRIVIRMHLEPSVSTTNSTANLCLVQDLEPGAGTPSWTDVFNGIGAGSNSMYNVAIPNFDKRARFRYLKRMVVPLAWEAAYYNAGATVSAKHVQLEMDVKLKGTAGYNNSSAIPYVGYELYLFGWSDVAANTPKCYASAQLFYTDA